MKRRGLVIFAGMAAGAAGAQPATPSEQRLQQLMQARKGTVPPERLAERARLLAEGETALSRRDTATALHRLEAAALVLHAADTEMALVRCHMQSGEYRRALAFGAHTAGAHLDAMGGTALYAWLLHAGGQQAIARRLLEQARARSPQQPLLESVQRELAREWPVAGTHLLAPPTRLAPYGQAVSGKMIASGTLVRGGRAALVPAACLRDGARYWVRNGLGDTVAAHASSRAPYLGLAELQLSQALPDPGLRASSRDPFPGSPAMAVEFAPHAAGLPAWPLLHNGFVGAALRQPGQRALGIAVPHGSPRGGPVFDRQGALCGIALNRDREDRLIGIARLREWSGSGLHGLSVGDGGASLAGPDAVYETGLKAALQLLRA